MLQLRHMLFRSPFFRKIPRQHELGFEHGAGRLDPAVEGSRHPAVDSMKYLPLHLSDGMAGVLLVPMPVQVLGHSAKLDHEVAGQVFGFGLAPFFLPKSDQRRLVVTHDDPGIRAADKGAAV
jgi:hypothetical protein